MSAPSEDEAKMSGSTRSTNAERASAGELRIDAQNPWPGLAAYEEQDVDFFRGREEEAARLRQLTQRHRLTLLFGPSGIGKTSLLKAGLFPILRRDNVLPVYVRLGYQPDAKPPGEQIIDEIRRAAAAQGSEPPAHHPGDSLWAFLHRRETAFWGRRHELLTPMLVLDQFEEIFTLGMKGPLDQYKACRDFFSELSALVDGRPTDAVRDSLATRPELREHFALGGSAYQILLCLREDYLPELEDWKGRIPAIGVNRMRLGRMSVDKATEAIASTGLANHAVAESIVKKVTRDAGEADRRTPHVELPILSWVCRELNERRKASGAARITISEAGSTAQILARFYEDSLRGIRGARRFVEAELVSPPVGQAPFSVERVRDAVSVVEAERRIGEAAVETLVARHLLRTDDREERKFVELTHDVLVQHVVRGAERREVRRRARRVPLGIAAVVALLLALSVAAVQARGRELDRTQATLRETGATLAEAVQRERQLTDSVSELDQALSDRETHLETTLAALDRLMQRPPPEPVAQFVPRGWDSIPSLADSAAEALWPLLDRTVESLRGMEAETPFVPSPGPEDCVLPSAAAAEAEAFGLRGDAHSGDYGLGLEAGVRSDFEDQPIEDGLPGAYVGLSMEMLQSGLFENRRLADLVRVRSEAARLRADVDESRQANACLAWSVDAAFVPLTRALLDAKMDAVRNLETTYRAAYLSGIGYLDDVLDTEREMARTRSVSRALQRVSAELGTEVHPALFPPAIDLDVAEIERRMSNDSVDARLVELSAQEARLSRQIESDTRLRFYVRYGVRPNNAGRNDQGFSGGAIFRMPLLQGNDAGLEAEIEAARRRTNIDLAVRRKNVRVAYTSFQEQLERVIRQHYLYLENFERTRRSAASWRLDPPSADLDQGLERLVGLFNAALERAAALRELYAAAARVFVAADAPYDPELVTRIDLPDTRYRARSGPRALYVWSESFNRLDNTFLLGLAEAKGFDRLLVSAGRNTNADKLERFRHEASAAGVDVELMLSTNAWLDPGLRAGVGARISGLTLAGGGLHLDIEPQALERYRDDPAPLLEAYVDVVERAREAAGATTRLTLSVPVTWPPDVYARLARMADDLYLMTYDEADPTEVEARVRPIADAVGADKLAVVLRASDFATEWEVDRVFAHLSEAVGVRLGAVHDLEGFLSLAEERR